MKFQNYTNIKILINTSLVFLIIFGLWASLHYVIYSWAPDYDCSYPAMLWYGIHIYGLGFIKSVIYTADNYLFSLTPIFFALFSTIGVNPYTVVITGWIIFISSGFLSGYIIWKATKNSTLALLTIVLSLLIGIYNNTASWISYPVSHDTSNMWLLINFIIAMHIFSNQGKNKYVNYILYNLLCF